MVNDTRFRPYAATANVEAVLNRVRSRNLPESITSDFLRLVGIPEAVYGRVTQAIRFLGLIDEDGRTTEKLQAMAGAPEAEYRDLLASTIQEAYAEDFRNVDPSRDPQPVILEAFRRYEPRSQTARMVMLFLGLSRIAGMAVVDAPRERAMQSQAKPRKTASRALGGAQRGSRTPVTIQPVTGPVGPLRDPGLLFGVSDEDIALLQEDEFQEVWGALGKIARARARAKQLRTAELMRGAVAAANSEDDTEEEVR